jgi:hypothetical protein
MRRRLICGFAGLCCVVLAGCYQKVEEKSGLTFTFQPWVPLLVALGGVIALPIGIVLFNRGQRFWGVLLAVGGPLIAGGVAPGMYMDRVVVNQDGFYSRHGFWFSPKIHDIRYEDLSQVKLVVEESTGRRGKSYSYYFDCSFKSGKQERVPLGDIMREALPEIAGQFRQHGVPVLIPPNLPG